MGWRGICVIISSFAGEDLLPVFYWNLFFIAIVSYLQYNGVSPLDTQFLDTIWKRGYQWYEGDTLRALIQYKNVILPV